MILAAVPRAHGMSARAVVAARLAYTKATALVPVAQSDVQGRVGAPPLS